MRREQCARDLYWANARNASIGGERRNAGATYPHHKTGPNGTIASHLQARGRRWG
jgi:hypothetical protein